MSPDIRRALVLLIVPDDDEAAGYHGSINRLGASCWRVPSLAEAQEILAQATPDVVLMDHDLPDANGPQATARLRGILAPDRVPIILLGRRMDGGEVEHAVMSGIYALLDKPAATDALSEVILSAISEEERQVPKA